MSTCRVFEITSLILALLVGRAPEAGAQSISTPITQALAPKGAPRADQVSPAAKTKKTWLFTPARDAFQRDALLDLRGLNEPVAGQSGFVRLTADGESFVLGDGKPVRFWAVTDYVQRDRSALDLAHHARFLAKRGVNMVRLHGHFEPKDLNARLDQVDRKAVEEAWKLVAAMKKEGIYVTLSPYWSANVKHVPKHWGIDGWPENEPPFGLLFFNPNLQSAYKAWLKDLLTPPNPHTGVALAQDPALALIQLQNEDSLLFWSAQNIKGKQAEELGRRFGGWLKAKYGSLARAFDAWGRERVPEDKPEQGIAGLLLVWEWTQPRTGGRKRRLDDQLQFYAETMHTFNREIERYLRDDLGCKQLVNAGNWRTADSAKLDDAERWSYTANEVLAVNRYYSPTHIGPDRGWRIDNEDYFEDVSVLRRPRELPLNLKQVAGHPMLITESHWVPPLGYQSEGPFLVAAYQSLSGIDGFYWFSTGETEWSQEDRAEWDSASRSKWSIATPMILGQFPANALIFRKGYLALGRPVIEEHRSLRQIWERTPPIIAEDPGYDPNRDAGDGTRRAGRTSAVNPLAFLAGPVKVQYDSQPSLTRIDNLSQYIDTKAQVVKSNTGQVRFEYGRGVCTIDAPCAQGATGFLKNAGPIALSSVVITSDNDYASLVVVSEDGVPLVKSRRVLVQVGTRARPGGWSDREATFTADVGKRKIHGKQVVSTGRMPWAVEESRVLLTVRNPALKRATVLDPNGNARGRVKIDAAGPSVTFACPGDALYVMLQAE